MANDHSQKDASEPIDRGHETPETTTPSGDRSTWSKRLELFDAPRASDTVIGGYQAPSAPLTRPDNPDDWEEISAGTSSSPESWSQASARQTASTEDAVWPDPDGVDINLAAARRENADRVAEITGLRGALGAAHHQLRARETDIAELTTRLSVATATTQARQNELNAVAARYKGVEEKLAATEQELALLRDKLQRGAEVAEKREAQIDNLRATRTTLEETLKARDRVIAARDEELGARDQELQAIRLRVSAQQKSIADRDAEMAMLADQLLTQQERGRALEAEIGGREQVVANQRDKLAERDEQLASLLATLDVVERTLARRPGAAEPGDEVATPQSPAPAPEPFASSGIAPQPNVSFDPPADPDLGHAPEAEEPAELEAQPQAVEEPAEVAKPDSEPADDADEEELGATGEADSDHEEPEPAVAEEGEALAAPEPELTPNAMEAESAADVEGVEVEAATDEAEAVEKDGTEDAGVEPGSALNADFNRELHQLAAVGDLFSQRPPPQTPIFRWWRDRQIENTEALPANSFDDLIVQTIARECSARADDTICVLSICGADPELEVRVARALVSMGHDNFVIDCFDDRQAWHDIRADVAEASDLSARIDSLPAEFDSFDSDQKYDVFIADASLPHAEDPGKLLEHIKSGWKDESVMVVSAALGSSSASATPENVETVDRIWNVMPDRYMLNFLTGEQQTNFVAIEAPTDAPGGGGALSPASTPILPMLLDGYAFEVFAVFGNLINAFVGPEIGPNFDPADESDRNFIERFSQLDEAQIDAGTLDPLHMIAVVRGSSVADTVMIENRAPERCLSLGQS